MHSWTSEATLDSYWFALFWGDSRFNSPEARVLRTRRVHRCFSRRLNTENWWAPSQHVKRGNYKCIFLLLDYSWSGLWWMCNLWIELWEKQVTVEVAWMKSSRADWFLLDASRRIHFNQWRWRKKTRSAEAENCCAEHRTVQPSDRPVEKTLNTCTCWTIVIMGVWQPMKRTQFHNIISKYNFCRVRI